jgi:hypothetical protein
MAADEKMGSININTHRKNALSHRWVSITMTFTLRERQFWMILGIFDDFGRFWAIWDDCSVDFERI